MGDIVSFPTSLEDNADFVADLCRFAEGLLTEAAVKKKYRFDDSTWDALGGDDALVEKIEAEKVRRMRSGESKREKSQLHVLRAPDVLGSIMDDPSANPRHRIDSAKVLDDFASNGPAGVPAADRFLIQINLGSDTLTFNKSIRPLEPGEIDPEDSTPNIEAGVVAAIATRKRDDGGGQLI
jgi:hypothetical protein